jgi:hypothetical protein
VPLVALAGNRWTQSKASHKYRYLFAVTDSFICVVPESDHIRCLSLPAHFCKWTRILEKRSCHLSISYVWSCVG